MKTHKVAVAIVLGLGALYTAYSQTETRTQALKVFRAAIESTHKAKTEYEDARADLLCYIAVSLHFAGFSQEAKDALDKALALAREQHEVERKDELYGRLSLAHMIISRTDEALKLTQQISDKREKARALMKLMNYSLETKQCDFILRLVRELLKLEPSDADPFLNELVFHLLQNQLFDCAEKLARKHKKTELLEQIRLMQKQHTEFQEDYRQLREAEKSSEVPSEATDDSSDTPTRQDPYHKVQSLIEENKLDEARAQLETIKSWRWRACAQAEIAHALAVAGKKNESHRELEKAYDLAIRVSEADLRVLALVGIIVHHNCARHTELVQRAYNEAVKSLKSVKDAEDHDFAAGELIDALLSIGFLSEARSVASQVREPSERLRLLIKIARAQLDAAVVEEAVSTADQAYALAERLADYSQTSDLIALAHLYARAGKTEKAHKAIDRWIAKASDERDSSYRNHQITSLAEELIGFGLAEEAFKILVAYFRPAEINEYSALGASEPFIDSVFILYKRRGLPHVLTQLRGSVSLLTESTVLERVVARYVDPLGEDKALEVASAIRKPDFRAKAFAAIGKYLARAGQYERAERIARQISELMRDYAEVRPQLTEEVYLEIIYQTGLEGTLDPIRERYLAKVHPGAAVEVLIRAASVAHKQTRPNLARDLLRLASHAAQDPRAERYPHPKIDVALAFARLGFVDDAIEQAQTDPYPYAQVDALIRVAYVLLGKNAFLPGPYGWDDNLHLFRERDEEPFPNDVRGNVPDF